MNKFITMSMCAFLCQLSATNDVWRHQKDEQNLSPTEDLMREHGLLNRLLLIYEELIKKFQEDNGSVYIPELAASVTIMDDFIHQYHEKLEEQYIFPLFRKHRKNGHLVKTLHKQHHRGRGITKRLQEIIATKGHFDAPVKKTIVHLLKKYITMYRPHEAREDTILFPKVHTLLTKQEFDTLGETFEKTEHELFGEDGFGQLLEKIKTIEKRLGIHDLDQFTPEKGL